MGRFLIFSIDVRTKILVNGFSDVKMLIICDDVEETVTAVISSQACFPPAFVQDSLGSSSFETPPDV